MTPPLTVGISTAGRPDELAACLRSLDRIAHLVHAIHVVDDGAPAGTIAPAVAAALTATPLAGRTTVHRHDERRGPCAGRNTSAALAETPFVLFLDDDVVIVRADVVEAATRLLEADASLGAVGFDAADLSGSRGPGPARRTATFIGFAHLVRFSAYRAAGGYREQLRFIGEEDDLALRMLDRGLGVAMLPGDGIAHVRGPAHRDLRAYLHLTVRNGVLTAAANLPMPLAGAVAVRRLLGLGAMRRALGLAPERDLRRVVAELRRELPATLRARQPVRWATVRAWRTLTRAEAGATT